MTESRTDPKLPEDSARESAPIAVNPLLGIPRIPRPETIAGSPRLTFRVPAFLAEFERLLTESMVAPHEVKDDSGPNTVFLGA